MTGRHRGLKQKLQAVTERHHDIGVICAIIFLPIGRNTQLFFTKCSFHHGMLLSDILYISTKLQLGWS